MQNNRNNAALREQSHRRIVWIFIVMTLAGGLMVFLSVASRQQQLIDQQREAYFKSKQAPATGKTELPGTGAPLDPNNQPAPAP